MRFRLILALASGLALWLAFPSHNQWLLAPVGVGLLALATLDVPARWGLLLGLVAGLACFVPVLSWSGVYVGKTPWLALAVLESLYIALVGWASALLQRAPSLAGAPRVRPLVIALLWVAQEALREAAPRSGVPLGATGVQPGRLPAGPPRRARWRARGHLRGGATGAVRPRPSPLGWCAPVRRPAREGGRRSPASAAPLAVLALAGGLLLAAARRADPDRRAAARFMAVQGNVPRGRAGVQRRAPGRPRQPRRGHPGRCRAVAAGTRPRPDLVVWPENSSDIDPLRNADAAAVINTAVDRRRRAGRGRCGARGAGPSTSPTSPAVPAPDRGSPSATSSSTRCRSPSTSRSGPSSASSATRSTSSAPTSSPARGRPCSGCPPRRAAMVAAGPVICFEVAYDGLIRDTVRAGANVLLVQTNNATFGYTDESEPAAGHLAGACRRARALDRARLHRRRQRPDHPRRNRAPAHRVVHISAARRSTCRCARPPRSPTAWAAWPEYLACGAVLLLLLRRGIPRRRRRVEEQQTPEHEGSR